MTDLMPRAAGEEPHAVPDDHLGHVADPAPVVHKAGEHKHLVRNVLTMILRIVLALVFGLPLLFMIVSSFKPDLQIFSDLTSIRAFLPIGDLSLDNYAGDLRTGAVRPVPDQLGDHHRLHRRVSG